MNSFPGAGTIQRAAVITAVVAWMTFPAVGDLFAQEVTMKKLTPILLVERIETSLPFWSALGFEKTVEVPHEDRLGFIILALGPCEVMIQSFASVEANDHGVIKSRQPGAVALYFEVDDIDAIEEKLGSAPVVVPRRKMFYGATEIFVEEPSGHIVGFAQFEK